MMFSDSRAGDEKEEVTMDTSENRPENEVPEPPLPVADQAGSDDRPEGSAEEEEKKEVLLPRKTLSKYLMYGNPPVKYNPNWPIADAASTSGPTRCY